MKKILRSFAVCSAMYSRVPMPKVIWDDFSMRYVFCFFPLIGLLIGALQIGWYAMAVYFSFSPILYAAVAVAVPILVTGGIHLDGYMDACDAIFSYGDKEKKLEIMKDPHTGAFAVMYCGVYLILIAGFYGQLFYKGSWTSVLMVAAGYLLSRVICGLSAVGLPCAKNSGLVHLFQNRSDRKVAKIALIIWLLAVTVGMALLSLQNAVVGYALVAVAVLLFVPFIKKNFGGVTGDLAGFILQICELLILPAALL